MAEYVENTDENVRRVQDLLEATGRKCGECYACCFALGIEALKKWPGQSCKHLDGSKGPECRCSIYETRPRACSHYYCAWLVGMGADDLRPDKAGALVTLYPAHDYHAEGHVLSYDVGPKALYSATIHVTDDDKAGNIDDPDSRIGRILSALTGEGCTDIRVMGPDTGPGAAVLHFHNGKVRRGALLKPGKYGYEELKFMTREPPIGTYESVERGSDAEKKALEYRALVGKGSLPPKI